MSRILPTRSVEKVWGRDVLPSPFTAPAGKRIGEIWFEPPEEMPELLLKFLFTSEKLSVQVHPSDADAPEGSRGKEECWLVLSADPGAQLAVGFKGNVSAAKVRTAAIDGSIESMLDWYDVAPGDFVYLPAGTVHAIGAGLSLIEVQQNSDVTYRLYDYGRLRRLHLDEAIRVADLVPHADDLRIRLPARGNASLVDGPYFRLDLIDGEINRDAARRYDGRPFLVLPLDGFISICGMLLEPGTCGIVTDRADLELSGSCRILIAQGVENADGFAESRGAAPIAFGGS